MTVAWGYMTQMVRHGVYNKMRVRDTVIMQTMISLMATELKKYGAQ